MQEFFRPREEKERKRIGETFNDKIGLIPKNIVIHVPDTKEPLLNSPMDV
jgi:hypothetical protein